MMTNESYQNMERAEGHPKRLLERFPLGTPLGAHMTSFHLDESDDVILIGLEKQPRSLMQ
jgi:hypothetical protein